MNGLTTKLPVKAPRFSSPAPSSEDAVRSSSLADVARATSSLTFSRSSSVVSSPSIGCSGAITA